MTWIEELKKVVNSRKTELKALKSVDAQNLITESEIIKFHFGENVTEERVRDFLKSKSPNQSEAEYKYELLNFQVTTKRIMMKLAGMFTKVINPANYSLKIDENLKYPKYSSLHDFYSTVYLNSCLIDPNAIRVTKPYFIPTTTSGDFDDTAEIQVFDDIVPFERIISISDTELVVASSERIQLENNQKGLIIEVYGLDTYQVYEQRGKVNDFEFENTITIVHNAGQKLWNKLGCDPFITEKGELLYRSPLSYVVPDLNTYLKNDSNLFVSTQGRLFAERIEIGDAPCMSCNGAGYHIVNDTKHTCQTCNGTGLQPRSDKLTTKFININALDDDARRYAIDSIRYVAPPQAPLEFVKEFLKEKEAQIYEAMNLHLTSKENETATGKRIDRDEQHTLLQRFADALFASMELSIIGMYVYAKKEQDFVLNPPVTFDRKSEKDLLSELNESKELNSTLTTNSQLNFAAQRYGEESQTYQDLLLQVSADRLINFSLQEKISLVGSGLAEDWEVYLSNSFVYIIEKLRNELEGKELSQKIEIIQEYAKANRGVNQ